MTARKRVSALVSYVAACVALPAAAFGEHALDELARGVERAESMRAVKNLQRTYSQYSQFGLWNEMAQLFADDATYIFDDQRVEGREAIAAYLVEHEGSGQ